MWDKLWEAIQKYGGSARDARIGAVGVDQVRDLYKSDKQEDKELAKELNDRYLAANAAGIAGGATAASALTAGIVPTLASEVGGAVGSYAGGEAGSYLDEQFGTQWISPTLSVLGGLGGGIAGYKTLKPSYNYLAKKGVIGYKDVPEDMIALPKGNTRHIGAETYGKTIVTNQPSIIRGGKHLINSMNNHLHILKMLNILYLVNHIMEKRFLLDNCQKVKGIIVELQIQFQ